MFEDRSFWATMTMLGQRRDWSRWNRTKRCSSHTIKLSIRIKKKVDDPRHSYHCNLSSLFILPANQIEKEGGCVSFCFSSFVYVIGEQTVSNHYFSSYIFTATYVHVWNQSACINIQCTVSCRASEWRRVCGVGEENKDSFEIFASCLGLFLGTW